MVDVLQAVVFLLAVPLICCLGPLLIVGLHTLCTKIRSAVAGRGPGGPPAGMPGA